MQIFGSGRLAIVSNYETMNFNLEGFNCSFSAEDTLGYFNFDYAEIFEMVCDTLRKSDYEIPTSEEDFYKSPLWKDLGFTTSPDFKIISIDKEIELEYYMTYGLNAAVSFDFETKEVDYNSCYHYRNALDSLIFEWPYNYDEEENQLNGSEILDDFADIYSEYVGGDITAKEVYEKTREQALSLYDEEGNPVSEDYVEKIIKLLSGYVEA